MMATAMNNPDLFPCLPSTPSGVIWRSISPSSFGTVYKVERCVSWIKVNKLSRVALQFPDLSACRCTRNLQSRAGQAWPGGFHSQ